MGVDPFELEGLHSPGGLAGRILSRMGVQPPLDKFDLTEDELAAWTQCMHGGWVTSGPLDGIAFPALDADVSSAYPAIAALLDWWGHICAEELRPVDESRPFRTFLARPDLAELMLMPSTWRRWGFTRVQVRADGQPFPVGVVADGEDAMIVVPTQAASLDVTWCDVVAAQLSGDTSVEVLAAVRFAPIGRQGDLAKTRYPGGWLYPNEDPIIALVRLRRWAKDNGHLRLAAQLRVLVNAMVYGNFARFDAVGDGREKPGPWCFPPMAALMAAGGRCLLVMVETEVRARGGVIAQRDTDGALIVASPHGGQIGLNDGTRRRVLPWNECDEILGAFDSLSPFGDGESFWDVNREYQGEPLRGVVWGAKKHALFVLEPSLRIIRASEHVIGAYAWPPGLSGFTEDGRHLWTDDVASVLAIGAAHRDKGTVPPFSWEFSDPGYPALRRISLSGPDALAHMPPALGLRPFARVVEARAAYRSQGARPIAPDPGGPLSHWKGLSWHDVQPDESIRVSTDPMDLAGVQLDSLRLRAVEWGRPRPSSRPAGVRVDERLVRWVGRGSARFSEGGQQLLHAGVDASGVFQEASKQLGSVRLAELTGLPTRTVEALAAGRAPRWATVERALLALRVTAAYDPLAYLLDEADGFRRCAVPGCEAIARPRSRTCSERHRKALSRLPARGAT